MSCKGWSKAGYGGGYRIIPREVLVGIDASAERQRATNPNVHRVYLLVRKLGMRSVEIFRARTSDIFEVADGKFAIRIISKKSGREEVIPRTIILSEVLVREFHKRGTDEFLIAPALAPTLRYNIIYKTTNAWLRNFLPGREKCLYELRKAAGSEVATADGLMAAQKFLGHKRYETTKQWYAEYVDETHALS